jgi:tRNA threonylcarbamoyladenosine biosynthesis protein TsaB
MLLLATDTSGKHGSIALAKGNADGYCQILEVVPLSGGTFSAQLVPQIAAMLAKHGFNKSQLDAFAVASGPGSFTGLRVGLAAIKGLAEVLGKPIATVSLLAAVAAMAQSEDKVTAALDAGRGEVFTAQVEPSGKNEEKLLSGEEFLSAATGGTVVTPDSGIAELARDAGLAVEVIERPDSAMIARLGWGKIRAGETVSADELDANYLRRSDAEIFAKRS